MSGTATSQSTVTNDQVQVGDIFSSQQLDVVTNSSDTTAATTATGNSFVGSVSSGDVSVQSTQQDSGATGAQTTLNVATDAGPSTLTTTAATANSGDSIVDGGGTLTGSYSQSNTSTTVDAESQTNAADAQTQDASISSQAVANGQQLGATGSTIDASVSQSNSASVTANGGVVFGDIGDQGAFASTAAANNLTATGSGAANQTLAVDQTDTGSVTQGAMFANFGQSEVTDTSAAASGDNIDATNTEGNLAVSDSQNNQSFVNAQSVETSYLWGGATVSAEGVGNSVVAANAGPSTTLSNTQVNGAFGVESSASFQGNTGYDVNVSSSATGNAATGFACSACGGVMNVTNSQTNLGDASASTRIGLTGGARSVNGVANAVGNTGTFYVSQPN